VPIDQSTLTHAADMAYAGQIHSLRVPIEPGWDAARLEQAFLDAYREKFGNVLAGIAVVIVNLRTIVVGARAAAALPVAAGAAAGALQPQSRRPVYFGAWHDTPVYARTSFAPGMTLDGPAIIEQSDTTTVVEPDMALTVDAQGNLLVKVK
jgi:N-methylhydantoinase A